MTIDETTIGGKNTTIDKPLAENHAGGFFMSHPTKWVHVKRLQSLRPMVHSTDTRTTRPPPKQMDSIYNTPEFIAFRAMVLRRAGYRCEAMDYHGHRCSKTSPEYRLYADHIRELKDGGSLTDLSNGQCLCRSHHEYKTIAARIVRHRS